MLPVLVLIAPGVPTALVTVAECATFAYLWWTYDEHREQPFVNAMSFGSGTRHDTTRHDTLLHTLDSFPTLQACSWSASRGGASHLPMCLCARAKSLPGIGTHAPGLCIPSPSECYVRVGLASPLSLSLLSRLAVYGVFLVTYVAICFYNNLVVPTFIGGTSHTASPFVFVLCARPDVPPPPPWGLVGRLGDGALWLRHVREQAAARRQEAQMIALSLSLIK